MTLLQILDKHGNRDIGYIFKRYYGNTGKVNMDHENFEICSKYTFMSVQSAFDKLW